MALPTTNLRLHVDASDTDKLFTTFSGSGVHTGTPSDGSLVQVWDDEGDGIANVALIYNTAGQTAAWRTTTPLMLHPCLDFDGSDDFYSAYTQTGGAVKAVSDFITASAFTVLVAFRAESITSTGAASAGHILLGDDGGYFGLSLRNVSGQRKISGYNWDGTSDVVQSDISENTDYVVMYRHESGNLYMSINGGSEVGPVASGNTQSVASTLSVGSLAGGVTFNGRIGEIAIYNAALSGTPLSDAISYFTGKWLSAGAYSLSVGAASYGLTGSAVGLRGTHLLPANAGSYSVSGALANLLYKRRLPADIGAYSISGAAVGLRAGRKIAALAGSYTWSGSVADLIRTGASSYVLVVDGGVYAVSGSTAGLLVAHKVPATSGAYTLSGTTAALKFGRVIPAASGVYVLTGPNADTETNRRLIATGGVYSITGGNVSLIYSGEDAQLIAVFIPTFRPRRR